MELIHQGSVVNVSRTITTFIITFNFYSVHVHVLCIFLDCQLICHESCKKAFDDLACETKVRIHVYMFTVYIGS